MPTVASGQTLNVTSGQTSTGVIVGSGGTLDVFFGGKASSTVDSGFVNVSGGRAISTTVVSGGMEEIVAGVDSLTLGRRRQGRERWLLEVVGAFRFPSCNEAEMAGSPKTNDHGWGARSSGVARSYRGRRGDGELQLHTSIATC